MRALSRTGCLRPFDSERDGFVISEGSAVVVLESWEHAVARGAPVYGRVLGSASTSDGHDLTVPLADGTQAARCVELALKDAAVSPADVLQINAHGTGTKLNDLAEASALRQVFGQNVPAVTSIKGATGHAFGASGAFEVVASLLSMRHGIIPPTIGLGEVDPAAGLAVVTSPGDDWEPGVTISNSFGFGGHNGCLVLGTPQDVSFGSA